MSKVTGNRLARVEERRDTLRKQGGIALPHGLSLLLYIDQSDRFFFEHEETNELVWLTEPKFKELQEWVIAGDQGIVVFSAGGKKPVDKAPRDVVRLERRDGGAILNVDEQMNDRFLYLPWISG